MRTVWKYPLDLLNDDNITELKMPQGTMVLTVQAQNDRPCLWAMVETDAEQEVRRFRILGTGHNAEHADDIAAYIGTVQLMGGTLVLHVFEVLP